MPRSSPRRTPAPSAGRAKTAEGGGKTAAKAQGGSAKAGGSAKPRGSAKAGGSTKARGSAKPPGSAKAGGGKASGGGAQAARGRGTSAPKLSGFSRVPLRVRAVVLGMLVAAVATLAISLRSGPSPDAIPEATIPAPPTLSDADAIADPFTYDPARRARFERRAAAGLSHALYARSPGGAQVTATRVAAYRPGIEAAAKAAGVSADLLEGLVFLESAGRAEAQATRSLEGAVGLGQILAETGQNFLGMHVDLAESRRLTRALARAERRGQTERAAALRAARRRADWRFSPTRSLQGMARYLQVARKRFGRQDLAVVSYHMGIGNLEGVLRAYVGDDADPDTPIARIVADEELTWARVYFDSSPLRHRAVHDRLTDLSDDSSNYLWKVLAGREIMRLHREDPDRLAKLSALQAEKNSAEEVLHPRADTVAFATPTQLRSAYVDGDLLAFPSAPARTGLARDRGMGELSSRTGGARELYRGLRPEAYALALYLGAQVRAISGSTTSSLTVTSTVRDERYQAALLRTNPEATHDFSLHTTGYAFDVLRRYASRRQALAFQFLLDRLTALNVIAWVREPAAIHITVSGEAAVLAPLLKRLDG